MGQFGIGQAVLRTEDSRLITGRGRYLDDVTLPHQTQAYVLRSPHAHARIVSIDTEDAAVAPGVVAVFTHDDLAPDNLGGLPCMVPLRGKGGKLLVRPHRPALADGIVRHVGDPVAFVVAETWGQARDAAELIVVEYEDRPAITDTAGAVAPDAPQVWDEAPGNICFDWEEGDKAKTDAAFDQAVHVVAVDLVNNRVVPNSMEGRGAIGDYDAREDRFTLHTSSQGSHSLRRNLSQAVFKLPENRFRVITPDVGGGFGMKLFLYPEQVLVLWAARKLARPVKWISDRSEAFLTDAHGRDHVSHGELALDAEGRILGVRVSTIANLGAYLSNFSPFIATSAGTGMLAGVYTTPTVYVEVKGVFTHTTPIDAYRGAGRPEANYLLERLIDAAGRQLGLGQDEIRRRNFIPPSAMPYATATGQLYDSGEFEALMDRAMQEAGWAGFPARREEARKAGKLRGIGMAYYVEACGGAPEEKAEIRLDETGSATILIGTQSNGQGHETAYAQIVNEKLGIDFDKIRVIQGDTDAVSHGRGTGGSRSVPVGGSALVWASDKIVAKGKAIAANLLEASEGDIEFTDGVFAIAGTDRSASIAEVVSASFLPENLVDGMEPGLDGSAFHVPDARTYPNGCHVVEVEIDRETGVPVVVRYTVVDDFGKVINPMLVAGQVHGGVVQGVGQALHENVVYDGDSGQLMSGSFMDYTMPRADQVPFIEFQTVEIPCTTNPLGIKGCGEAGAIGAPPAVINAIVDALAELGVDHVDMPATPLRIWQLVNRARAA